MDTRKSVDPIGSLLDFTPRRPCKDSLSCYNTRPMPAVLTSLPCPSNTHWLSGVRESEPTMGLRYDPASQVTNILHQLTATSTSINQAAYAYNPVGNRTSLTDRRGSQAFGYDTLDRLTSASHPMLATPQAFAYDPVGHRTTGGQCRERGEPTDRRCGHQERGSGVVS